MNPNDETENQQTLTHDPVFHQYERLKTVVRAELESWTPRELDAVKSGLTTLLRERELGPHGRAIIAKIVLCIDDETDERRRKSHG
jgi:hypothetical protein